MTSDTRPCTADPRYGTHVQAHVVVPSFAEQVDAILKEAEAAANGACFDTETDAAVAARVAEAMAPLLGTPDLLCAELRATSTEKYRKHILHADPAGRFTLLALVWLPGQETVIHAHTAWGAVGVYEGEPQVTCYDCEECDGRHVVTETKDVRCAPGDTATVRRGICDVHRIGNPTDKTMITLHAYGRDLVEDPDAINLYLSL